MNKGGSPDPVTAGETVEYAITVCNDGPSTARNVRDASTRSARAPEYLTFLGYSIQAGTGVCYFENVGTPDVKCDLGDLEPGDELKVFLTLRGGRRHAGTARCWTTR